MLFLTGRGPRVMSFLFIFFFFFNDTATTEIYTLSLHDALPIPSRWPCSTWGPTARRRTGTRSEEHTSELQSRENLVCRLLLEKKKKKTSVLFNYIEIKNDSDAESHDDNT